MSHANGAIIAPRPRRFPPPWSVEVQPAYFVVIDSAGQKLAYVYFEEEPGRRPSYSRKMRRAGIAANIATLPQLLHKS
jgi:hypothetical protein